jgi:hypothetical protein
VIGHGGTDDAGANDDQAPAHGWAQHVEGRYRPQSGVLSACCLITPSCTATPCVVPHTPQKLFATGLAVTIAVPISTIGDS